MPIDCYDGMRFELGSTSGEAEALFGKVPVDAHTTPPTLTISIDKANAQVSFSLTSARPQTGRDFVAEAQARYIDGEHFNSQNWPDAHNDIIIGHINWGIAGRQQMFLMWSRALPKANAAGHTHRLGFFFFANRTRFSGGGNDMSPAGIGQGDGGGDGTGTYHPPIKP